MTTGFDLDEIERLLAAATGGPWRKGSRRNCDIDIIGKPSWPCKRFGKAGEWDVAVVTELENTKEQQANAALIVTLRNSAPAMIAAIRELRAENARLKGHWSALDKALADNIIETDQPHRVRWEGEWHYGPLADAYFAMTSVVRKLARAALGEPQ